MGYLSDVARRRVAAALLALIALVAALAVSDRGPFADPPTPEEKVRTVVEDFFGAAAAGDFDRYCDLLTQQAQDTVRANAARLIANSKIGGCPAILHRFGRPLEDGKLKLRSVNISGNRARAEVGYTTPSTKGPQPRTVLLELDPEGWRVYDPG